MTRPATRSAAAGDRHHRQGAGGSTGQCVSPRTGGTMADVNIQQTPSSGESRSGGSGAVWAVVVIILLLVIAWFVFGGGFGRRSSTTNLNVNVPGQSGGGSGSGGAGSGGGTSGGGTGGGATKTP